LKVNACKPCRPKSLKIFNPKNEKRAEKPFAQICLSDQITGGEIVKWETPAIIPYSDRPPPQCIPFLPNNNPGCGDLPK